MKKFLGKSFTLSIIFGVLAVACCLLSIIMIGNSMAQAILILSSLGAGFLGFIMGCLHIIAVQRYEIKQAPVVLLLLSLFLNSIPLIYMMAVVTHAKHS
jgi:hypothetical protein